MQLSMLLNELPSYQLIGHGDPIIQNVHMDSREVSEGSLFFCVKGFTVDGHDFAVEAVKKGAVAIVAEEDIDVSVPLVKVKNSKRAMALLSAVFFDYPTSKFQLIGVTGTNGKTTTTHLIEKLLSDSGKKTGIIGTMYMKYGEKKVEVNNTTPESLVLQKNFYEMKKEGVDAVTMEVSSHALELGRVHGSHFDIAVFTNISQDHLDFHETMERYTYAKGLLFAQLGNGFKKDNQPIAILNIDDQAFCTIERMTASPIITYGIRGDADLKAVNINLDESGASFDLSIGNESVPIKLNMTGTFSIYNALAAAATAYTMGISLDVIQTSLSKVEGVSGRFERLKINAPFHVIVDYAHTPDSLQNVLQTIKEFAKGKISVVVGCGGDRDKGKRPLMAKIAEEFSNHVYLTSDNPRTEEPLDIIKDMEQGMSGSNYTVIENRREAIFEVIRQAQENEVILIAGKGHETYQTIGKMNHYFDDRVVAKEAVEECQNHEN
ncbi:UDP-N-acetylmuramoyl-L-alanyl-D-glutamate--2,6-diaminopimelate ligase [Evansella sp. AB-P1]|uniref:UDP-N-acetylmuramoyl-L-alanyl-D-glutamate--2, 6-diaminopimelate ligase n=1 Tax=Evansella sp. AB-P1 TaxID=3037653 RepID=UPI00241E29AA|nr:UDP-N-acetylmuramoyl-L-alanyl-D-glutamate--2,6-diaminopimelate ligase [Evansella sp. AB-P1]MDG5788292.1 UDP-N-acetylmuramoyl-L-alanyl-D-glutamate--2,6-diaminopimelate ligase [Evansella sp. AB-P1]